jgi:aryl-alcohol dehydrogenase-like predicted oxidoreductase
MEMRNLGRSGLRISLIGLGCNNFGDRVGLDEARQVVHKALDLGVTFFDTADRYGGPGASEAILGEIFGPRRKDIVIATKFGISLVDRTAPASASRRYIMSAVEGSLTRLKTDWIDLYQVHLPDPLTPIEETLRALDDLVRQGKVRYIGTSNFAAWQVVEAEWTARGANLERFVSVQDEYSLAYRGHEKELIPAIKAHSLGFLPYRPLASGILTGKYRRDEPPPDGTRLARMKHHAEKYIRDSNFDVAERLGEFALARGHTLTELAFSWLAAQPFVSSIIPGATKPRQIEENVAAVGWRLSPDDLAEVDRLSARQIDE